MNSMFFNENGYIIMRNVLNEQTINLLKTEIKITEKKLCFEKNKKKNDYFFSDNMCNKSFSAYSLLGTEALLNMFCTLIEDSIGLKLFPTYSYSRIYYKGSILKKHIDRSECEISVSLCLLKDNEDKWKFFLEDKNKNEICIDLDEGDMVIYMGTKLSHWRNEFLGNEHIQIFLHYVNKYGENSNSKYDGRYFLGLQK